MGKDQFEHCSNLVIHMENGRSLIHVTVENKLVADITYEKILFVTCQEYKYDMMVVKTSIAQNTTIIKIMYNKWIGILMLVKNQNLSSNHTLHQYPTHP